MIISGTGSALPKKIVTNDMLSEFLDTSDEWIVPRTGIKKRHIITNELLEDLGAEAVQKALDNAKLKVEDIDLFVCSNTISEYITPGLGSVVASKIGLTCPCIDINAACTGFIYGLDIAETYYKAGKIKNAIVLCAEEASRMPSWEDRATCILFGDGAAAIALTPGDNIKDIELHSLPNADKIWQKKKLGTHPYLNKEEHDVPLQMKGKDVFKFAVNACTKDVEELLQKLNINKKEISYFIVHQANKRIIDSIKSYLDIEESRFPSNIENNGNTSSASCPLLLDECNKNGLLKKGDLIVFSAFGAGLLSGVAVVEW